MYFVIILFCFNIIYLSIKIINIIRKINDINISDSCDNIEFLKYKKRKLILGIKILLPILIGLFYILFTVIHDIDVISNVLSNNKFTGVNMFYSTILINFGFYNLTKYFSLENNNKGYLNDFKHNHNII